MLKRANNCRGEFWRMPTSQQESPRAEGVSRHVWERSPLAGHSVLFMHRAWKSGRLTAYVKNYSSYLEKIDYQQLLALDGSRSPRESTASMSCDPSTLQHPVFMTNTLTSCRRSDRKTSLKVFPFALSKGVRVHTPSDTEFGEKT